MSNTYIFTTCVTFQSKPGEVANAVRVALRSGYPHVDCAHVYGNEPEVGAALKEVFSEGKVKREDIFITSKVLVLSLSPIYSTVLKSHVI